MKANVSAMVVLVVALVIYALWPGVEQKRSAPVTASSGEQEADTPAAPVTVASGADLPAPTPPIEVQTSVAGTARMRETGEPVAGVIVRAYDQHKDTFYETTTDEAGAYALRELHPGERGVDIGIEAHTELEGHHATLVHPLKRLYPGDQWTEFDIEIVPSTGVVTGRVLGKERVYFTNRVRSNIEALLSDLSIPATQQAWEDVSSEVIAPLDGIRVVLTLNQSHYRREIERIEARTDASGRYRIEGVPVGAGSVEVIPEGRSVSMKDGWIKREFRIADGEVLELDDLTLDADAVTVTGRVVDADGQPIPNAHVVAEPAPYYEEGYREGRATVAATTDDTGNYALPGLRPGSFNDAIDILESGFAAAGGTYLVRADAPGFAPAQVAVPILQQKSVEFALALDEAVRHSSRWPELQDEMGPPAQRPRGVFSDDAMQLDDLVLHAGSSVSGVVVDTHGRAQAHAELRLISEKPERYVGFEPYPADPEAVKVEGTGAFAVTDIPAAVYRFEVTNDRGATLRARNEPLQVESAKRYDNVEVVIESTLDRGGIAGTITEALTNVPVTDFTVQIVELKSPDEPHPQYGSVNMFPDTGRFRIEGISAGDMIADIHAEGYAPERIEIRIEPGKFVELDIALHRGGTLRGRTSINGEIAGAWITIEGLANGFVQSYGDEGVYEMLNLKPGTYLVKYSNQIEGGPVTTWDTEYRWAEVESGRETILNVDFGGPCAIEGAFSGPEDLRWFVRVDDETIPVEDKFRAMAGKFEETGRYVIDNLAPGTYTVTGIVRKGEEIVAEDARLVTLAAGERLTLDFDL